MAWFWHGHFVSGIDKVNFPSLMVQQLRTYRSLALVPFPKLVRAATVDAAMLLYLDGATSTGDSPNENYGRELLELFTLGIGNYTENDVQAGARALTGWTVRRRDGRSQFERGRHTDEQQTYLGVSGVHDVDTVVAAVTGHPQSAQFIAGKLAAAILGQGVDPGLVAAAGDTLRSERPRYSRPRPRDPRSGRHRQRWRVGQRTGAVAGGGAAREQARRSPRVAGCRACARAGQLPFHPPNVAGWPVGTTWFGASTVVARYDLAAALAQGVSTDTPAFAVARSFDLDVLADALGRPSGFTASTKAVRWRRSRATAGACWRWPSLLPTWLSHEGPSLMLTRRQFLGLSGGAAVTGATTCGGTQQARIVPRAARLADTSPRVLVVVQLSGGNDALNTVVPRDGHYHDLRPHLAIADDKLLSLSGATDVGFHPALQPLVQMWDARQLAVLPCVGFSTDSRSHFESQDVWWTASPTTS